MGDLGIDRFDILEPTIWINNTSFIQLVRIDSRNIYMIFHIKNGAVEYMFLKKKGLPGYGIGSYLKAKAIVDGYFVVTMSSLDLGLGTIWNNTLYYGLLLYNEFRTIDSMAIVGRDILVLSVTSRNTSTLYYYKHSGGYHYGPALKHLRLEIYVDDNNITHFKMTGFLQDPDDGKYQAFGELRLIEADTRNTFMASSIDFEPGENNITCDLTQDFTGMSLKDKYIARIKGDIRELPETGYEGIIIHKFEVKIYADISTLLSRMTGGQQLTTTPTTTTTTTTTSTTTTPGQTGTPAQGTTTTTKPDKHRRRNNNNNHDHRISSNRPTRIPSIYVYETPMIH